MNQIDGHLAVRLLIENAFSHLTWHETACRDFGFRGISQVWMDEPAWYFWLHDIEGAFLLRLHDEEPIDRGRFVSLTVHYYPAPGSRNQQVLSSRERQIILDDKLFDQRTCTPCFEAFEVCRDFFICAEIGLMIDAQNRLQMLVYGTEGDLRQPADRLLDLLVKTLNFASGAHHCSAWRLKEEQASSLLLVYDQQALAGFLSCFGLTKNDLQPAWGTEHLEQWRKSSHMAAVCSVHGTCSCH